MCGQVFETVNGAGVYCNLRTGQEKKDVLFADHLACTVEMAHLGRQWDVAIIDEIQVICFCLFMQHFLLLLAVSHAS